MRGFIFIDKTWIWRRIDTYCVNAALHFYFKRKSVPYIIWERTGFDLEPYARLQAEDNGWPL